MTMLWKLAVLLWFTAASEQLGVCVAHREAEDAAVLILPLDDVD